MLSRQLMKSQKTGRVIERDRKSGCDWRHFTFPTRWHYDILWALDYLGRAKAPFDERMADVRAWWPAEACVGIRLERQ